MARDPWIDDVYSRYDYFFFFFYVRRRKQVDNIRLDWLDIEELYRSPAVVLFSKEEILEKSNWSEEEVSLLFADRRFPMTEVARKQVVEVHALIQFFARKEVIKIKQLEDRAQMDLIFAHLKK